MTPTVRNILGIILGIATAFGTIFLVEELGHQIYPPSERIISAQENLSSIPPSKTEQIRLAREELMMAMKEYLTTAPLGAMLMVLIAWFCGALFGSFVSAAIAANRRQGLGLAIGMVVLLATVANFIALPYHPIWMMIVAVILILPCSFLGTRLAIQLFPHKDVDS